MDDMFLIIVIQIIQSMLDSSSEFFNGNIPNKYIPFYKMVFFAIINIRLYVLRSYPYSKFSLLFILLFLEIFFEIVKIKILQFGCFYFLYQLNNVFNDFLYSTLLLLARKFIHMFFNFIYMFFLLVYHILGFFTMTTLSIYFIFYISSIFDSFIKADGIFYYLSYIWWNSFAFNNNKTNNDLKNVPINIPIENENDIPFDNTSICVSDTSPKKKVSFLNEPLIRYFEKNTFYSDHSNSSDEETSQKAELAKRKGINRKNYSKIAIFVQLGDAFNRMNFPIEGHHFYFK